MPQPLTVGRQLRRLPKLVQPRSLKVRTLVCLTLLSVLMPWAVGRRRERQCLPAARIRTFQSCGCGRPLAPFYHPRGEIR
jgi:hypothetical protein